ncbi:hypothetical protein D3C84_1115490 [compost metagenome]
MGVLLAFMFVWNMVGALLLLPALAYFLLPSTLRSDASGSKVANPMTLSEQSTPGHSLRLCSANA